MATSKWLVNSFEVAGLKAIFADSYFSIISQLRKSALIIRTGSTDSYSTLAAMMLSQSEFVKQLFANKTVWNLGINPEWALSFLYCVHPFVVLVPNYLNLVKDKSKFLFLALDLNCECLLLIVSSNIQIFAVAPVNCVYLLQACCLNLHIEYSVCIFLVIK